MSAALASAHYLLDANVISELMRPAPNESVLAWLDGAGVKSLATASPVIWEVRYGLATMPEGRRQAGLEEKFEELLDSLFSERIAVFRVEEAVACADIMAAKRALGESLDGHLPDAMIAACAITSGLAAVTRNEMEFRNTGVEIVNPWDE